MEEELSVEARFAAALALVQIYPNYPINFTIIEFLSEFFGRKTRLFQSINGVFFCLE
jgi:hypothetical protein